MELASVSSRSRDWSSTRNLSSPALLSPRLLPQAWPLAHQLFHSLGDRRTDSSRATSLWLEFQREKINIPASCYMENLWGSLGLVLPGSRAHHWLVPVVRCGKWSELLPHLNYRTSDCWGGSRCYSDRRRKRFWKAQNNSHTQKQAHNLACDLAANHRITEVWNVWVRNNYLVPSSKCGNRCRKV